MLFQQRDISPLPLGIRGASFFVVFSQSWQNVYWERFRQAVNTEHVCMTNMSFFWSTDLRNERHCNGIKIINCPICPGQEEKKEKEI